MVHLLPLVAAALVAVPAIAATDAADTSVAALTERFIAIELAHNPLQAYEAGLPLTNHGRLPANSVTALEGYWSQQDRLLAEVRQAQLSADGADGEALDLALMREALEADRGTRICRPELWTVSHYRGWQVLLADAIRRQPVGTPQFRQQALARWSSLPAYLDTEIGNLRRGLDAGYSASQPVVRRVIRQLDLLLGAPVEESPFNSPAERDEDPAFRAEWRALLTDRLRPAIRVYRDFLEREYLPPARTSLAVSDQPDGPACYQALLRRYTTVPWSPRRIYELGRSTVASNAREVVEIGAARYRTRDPDEIIRLSAASPENGFDSAEELLALSREMLEALPAKLAPLFVTLPTQPVIIEPLPAFQEGSGVTARYEADADPANPGRYWIPLSNWRTQKRGDAEINLVHETLPGHHLQNALSRRFARPSPIAKLVSNSAYGEGWGRYAERLADEAGAFRSDFARITHRAWAARGMVVDPGIHAFGWNRERAVSYLVSTGRFDAAASEALVDRIATMPGQLTSYDVGALEIMNLRREAEAALGPAFDIRQFHQRVLEIGAVPLPQLRSHVREWVRGVTATEER